MGMDQPKPENTQATSCQGSKSISRNFWQMKSRRSLKSAVTYLMWLAKAPDSRKWSRPIEEKMTGLPGTGQMHSPTQVTEMST